MAAERRRWRQASDDPRRERLGSSQTQQDATDSKTKEHSQTGLVRSDSGRSRRSVGPVPVLDLSSVRMVESRTASERAMTASPEGWLATASPSAETTPLRSLMEVSEGDSTARTTSPFTDEAYRLDSGGAVDDESEHNEEAAEYRIGAMPREMLAQSQSPLRSRGAGMGVGVGVGVGAGAGASSERLGGLAMVIEEATRRASRTPAHTGLGGRKGEAGPFSDDHHVNR